MLRTTQLPIPADRFALPVALAGCGLRNAAWWADAMKGQDFRTEDHLDTDRFNAALWQGLGRGSKPADRTGTDLRRDRTSLMAAERSARTCSPVSKGSLAAHQSHSRDSAADQ